MNQEEVKDQLKTRVGPDDEVINFIFTLVEKSDSQLCEIDGSRRLSFFFRTYFITNLLKDRFESDSEYSYNVNVPSWSQKKKNISTQYIFVPVHIVNKHCVLSVIFITNKYI